MNQKVIITIAVALIVLGGGLVYMLSQGKTADNGTDQPGTSTMPSNEATTDTSGAPTTSETASSLTIIFTNDGFDKASYSVKAGSVVTVKNESDNSVQFSSADHPTHLENPEMNMKELTPGESGSFTPTTKGAHGFHNHINNQYTGILVVE